VDHSHGHLWRDKWTALSGPLSLPLSARNRRVVRVRGNRSGQTIHTADPHGGAPTLSSNVNLHHTINFRAVSNDKMAPTSRGFPGGRNSLEKPPDLDPFFDDLTRAKSAKELKEHLETRVL